MIINKLIKVSVLSELRGTTLNHVPAFCYFNKYSKFSKCIFFSKFSTLSGNSNKLVLDNLAVASIPTTNSFVRCRLNSFDMKNFISFVECIDKHFSYDFRPGFPAVINMFYFYLCLYLSCDSNFYRFLYFKHGGVHLPTFVVGVLLKVVMPVRSNNSYSGFIEGEMIPNSSINQCLDNMIDTMKTDDSFVFLLHSTKIYSKVVDKTKFTAEIISTLQFLRNQNLEGDAVFSFVLSQFSTISTFMKKEHTMFFDFSKHFSHSDLLGIYRFLNTRLHGFPMYSCSQSSILNLNRYTFDLLLSFCGIFSPNFYYYDKESGEERTSQVDFVISGYFVLDVFRVERTIHYDVLLAANPIAVPSSFNRSSSIKTHSGAKNRSSHNRITVPISGAPAAVPSLVSNSNLTQKQSIDSRTSRSYSTERVTFVVVPRSEFYDQISYFPSLLYES